MHQAKNVDADRHTQDAHYDDAHKHILALLFDEYSSEIPPKKHERGNSMIEVNTLERYDCGTNQSNRPFLQGLKPLSVGP